LSGQGDSPSAIDETVEWARQSGYVDDLELSEQWIETRAARKGLGRRRLLLELEDRGVDRSVAEDAWRRVVDDGRLDPEQVLNRAVSRRVSLSGGRLDRRRYARVYNALLRAGFDPPAVRVALEPHRALDGTGESRAAERTDHDLP
jgi:regulatory protein